MNETGPFHSSFNVNCVFNAFSAYTAIMLNILTIHAIRKTSSLPKPLKTLLQSLALSDLGVGLLAQPLYIASMVNPTDFVFTCNVMQFIFSLASFFSVVAISVDRFLAVHLHLRYQELVTRRRVVAVVISIWTLSVLHSVIDSISSNQLVNVIKLVVLGLCFIITAIVNCRIYFTVRRHSDQIQVIRIQVAQNNQLESAARQKKSFIGTLYIYLVFLVCSLPSYCIAVASFISPPKTALRNMFNFYALTLFFLNSSLNPVIYGWKMRPIRLAMIEVLRKLFPRQNQENL